MSQEIRILVPRLMDSANTNAQNLNARALLSRFKSPGVRWTTTYYDPPVSSLCDIANIELKKLWRTRLWHWHMLSLYPREWDAIFYPGMEWFDERGLLRKKRNVPVIGTLEGLAGDEQRERRLSEIAGHRVFCQRVGVETFERCDAILKTCDHIVAITPMLAKLGREMYGDKVSTLPLGIDTSIFHRRGERKSQRFRVVGAGNVKENKRPEIFLELGRRLPDAEFVWYGQGPLLDSLRQQVAAAGLKNLQFPGTALPNDLAETFSNADLFVLPSFAEGAPKVLQEAGACGLPRIAYGFYEPTIANEVDGFIVWNDEELFERVRQLSNNREAAHRMGQRAAEIASTQSWDHIAPQWEQVIIGEIR